MFLNDCYYFKFFNGQSTDIFIIGNCVISGEPYSVIVSEEALYEIENSNKQLQQILPHHSIYDREFLITGICPKCQLHDIGQFDQEKAIEKLSYRFDRLKTDYKKFSDILNQNEITSFYHFTDIENIKSIKEKGALYSLQYLHENNIMVNRPGSSSLSQTIDYEKDLANYIRLSFVRDHPMLHIAMKDGRISTPIIIEIDVKLLFTEPSKFTLINAADKKASIYNDSETFSKINFRIFKKSYFDLIDNEKRQYQAEILIPERIEFQFIKSITVLSDLN